MKTEVFVFPNSTVGYRVDASRGKLTITSTDVSDDRVGQSIKISSDAFEGLKEAYQLEPYSPVRGFKKTLWSGLEDSTVTLQYAVKVARDFSADYEELIKGASENNFFTKEASPDGPNDIEVLDQMILDVLEALEDPNVKDKESLEAELSDLQEEYRSQTGNYYEEDADREYFRKYMKKTVAGEDDEDNEPDYDSDCFITDERDGYLITCYGKNIGTVDDFDKGMKMIRDWMRSNGFYTAIWHCYERGNIDRIDNKGNVIIASKKTVGYNVEDEMSPEEASLIMQRKKSPPKCPECGKTLGFDRMDVLRCWNEEGCSEYALTADVPQPIDFLPEDFYDTKKKKKKKKTSAKPDGRGEDKIKNRDSLESFDTAPSITPDEEDSSEEPSSDLPDSPPIDSSDDSSDTSNGEFSEETSPEGSDYEDLNKKEIDDVVLPEDFWERLPLEGRDSDIDFTKESGKGNRPEGWKWQADRFLETLQIIDNIPSLDDIEVEATPKGNWTVYWKGSKLCTVNGELLDDETVEEFDLRKVWSKKNDPDVYDEASAVKDAEAYYRGFVNYIPDQEDIISSAADFLSDEIGTDYDDCYDSIVRYLKKKKKKSSFVKEGNDTLQQDELLFAIDQAIRGIDDEYDQIEAEEDWNELLNNELRYIDDGADEEEQAAAVEMINMFLGKHKLPMTINNSFLKGDEIYYEVNKK